MTTTAAPQFHLNDTATWARELGISEQAVALYAKSEVIDLHIDTFLCHRMWGYDFTQPHGTAPFFGVGFGHCDIPRLRRAGVGGAMWSITTNPLRRGQDLEKTFFENLKNIKDQFARLPHDVAVVRNHHEYTQARKEGKHAAMIVVQGGQAFQENLDALEHVNDEIVCLTLVHLSNSRIGVTSSPLSTSGGNQSLTDTGRELVRRLNQQKILVDLAHISPQGFWDALDVHDTKQPVAVTHTGVKGVWEHWRNLDDDQVRAVAKTGGVIGIMYQGDFLGPEKFRYSLERIVDHMEHVVNVAGEDFVALGSDWDGLVITPHDMPSCMELPRLVQAMLNRGWKEKAIQKALGGNFLRVFKAIRP